MLVVYADIPRATRPVRPAHTSRPAASALPAANPVPPQRSERSLSRWKVRVTEHQSVTAFLTAKGLGSGIHSILGGESPIDLLIRARRGAPMIFSFHGSLPRAADLKLPVFAGLDVTRNLDASLVAISDPTLHLDGRLRLGWHAGSAGLRMQTILPTILNRLTEIFDAPRVLFLGGSGGGYASLYYAADFPTSLAIAWNPHTDIRSYEPSHVEDFGRVAFGWNGIVETRERLAERIDCSLIPVYLPDARNLVLYLQNNTHGHVLSQMRPFLAALGADVTPLRIGAEVNARVTTNVWLNLAPWGDGHASPPPEFLAALLREVLAAADWRAEVGSGRIGERIAAAHSAAV